MLESFRKLFLNQWRYFYRKLDEDIEKNYFSIFCRICTPLTNIVYLIECSKCSERYIGESIRSLKSRLADHRGYINRDLVDTATGAHFHTPGHNLSHLTITILEQQKNKNQNYRKEREKYLINLFNTYYRGMNKQMWEPERGEERGGFCIYWLMSPFC